MTLPFNKMFVMLPVMLLARKLDGEDAQTVLYARVAYGVMQALCILFVFFVYFKACATGQQYTYVKVYVPPQATPFADPNAKKKYTETTYGAHVISNARSLLGSTLFGVALTVLLHYYKGMIMGLAIQAVMAPLNLIENPLVKAIFAGNGIRPEDHIFDEKSAAELTADDEVVDDAGNPVTVAAAGNQRLAQEKKEKTFEDVLLDTWDAGSKADLAELLAALNKKNLNYKTKDDQWTPIMVLAGLGAPGSAAAIVKVIEMGADPAVTDKEGWNALHWVAFHGSVDAAKTLAKSHTHLLSVTDKDGLTPIETAKKEKNDDVAEILEAALGEVKKDK